MSKGITPIVQTFYEISNVQHQVIKTKLSYSDKAFTYIKSVNYAEGMELISVNDLGQLINNYSNADGGKLKDRCMLKGLYSDNFKGENCYKNTPYLFFDIDVKEGKENVHLLHPEANQMVFNELQKVSVTCWRSNSGIGIAGVLYVPQLANYLNEDRNLHLQAGKEVTNILSTYLHTVTGIEPVKFDNAQSKFRQARFLAEQKHERFLNNSPFVFSYSIEEKIKEFDNGVTVYKPHDFRQPNGTILQQFENENDILTIAQRCGFEIVGSGSGNSIRVKHPKTTSGSSGSIDRTLNIFFNHSESLSGRKSYTPSQLLCEFEFNNDWSEFYKYLKSLNYKEKQTPETEIKDVSKALKCELLKATNEDEESKIIFKYCYDLQTLPTEQKKSFIKENLTRPELKKHFVAYLKLNDYKIKYDKEIFILKYVSEALKTILDYADEKQKVILRAETGTGKTTAFFKDFHTHRPNCRILVLMPLTVILEQNRKEYFGKAVFLDGTSSKAEHIQAEYESFVVATYEQGEKLLKVSGFDYIVIDEVHQLLTANSFKSDVIAKLTPFLNESIVIGLTGTPPAIFKNLGYSLLNVDVKNPTKTKIEVRLQNAKPFNIALSHLMQCKGKVLIRWNDIEGIEALRNRLIEIKLYNAEEILVLHSTKKIKGSNAFKQLAHNRIFDKKIRLVLTTALIDEGLSINQTGFTDVVFIETSYTPRPEAQKQFFARFRNDEPTRKNYLYLRKKENQNPSRFNPEQAFNEILEGLKDEAEESTDFDFTTAKSNLFSNESYYYDDRTINKFYLAYSVTDTLFKTFNINQYLNFLTSNYNIEITEQSNVFEIECNNESILKAHRKELKQKIALAWCNNKADVLQSLAIHSLNKSIRTELSIQQMALNSSIESFVIDKIKEFEKLYKKHKVLKGLGVVKIDRILIAMNNEGSTLISEKKYKDKVTELTLQKMLLNPNNETDKIAGIRVVKFAEWCKSKAEFSHSQMFRKLKELRVYKNSDYSLNFIITVLKWFDLEAKKDTNTGNIKVTSINNIKNV